MNALQIVARISISIGFLCLIIILIDILSGNKQHMMIMNYTFIFWFVMQFAMMPGFLTAYPVNWLLIKKALKKKCRLIFVVKS